MGAKHIATQVYGLALNQGGRAVRADLSGGQVVGGRCADVLALSGLALVGVKLVALDMADATNGAGEVSGGLVFVNSHYSSSLLFTVSLRTRMSFQAGSSV